MSAPAARDQRSCCSHGYGETGDMGAPMAADLAPRSYSHRARSSRARPVLQTRRGLRQEDPGGGRHGGDGRPQGQARRCRGARYRQHGRLLPSRFSTRARHQARPDRRTSAGGRPVEEILKNPLLWHFRFGGPDMERLVAGRERIYLVDRFWNESRLTPRSSTKHQGSIMRRSTRFPAPCIPDLAQFAAFDQDAIDNRAFIATRGKLKMPVLAVGGEKSSRP